MKDNTQSFSVLMTISESDNESYLKEALKSITIDQTIILMSM